MGEAQRQFGNARVGGMMAPPVRTEPLRAPSSPVAPLLVPGPAARPMAMSSALGVVSGPGTPAASTAKAATQLVAAPHVADAGVARAPAGQTRAGSMEPGVKATTAAVTVAVPTAAAAGLGKAVTPVTQPAAPSPKGRAAPGSRADGGPRAGARSGSSGRPPRSTCISPGRRRQGPPWCAGASTPWPCGPHRRTREGRRRRRRRGSVAPRCDRAGRRGSSPTGRECTAACSAGRPCRGGTGGGHPPGDRADAEGIAGDGREADAAEAEKVRRDAFKAKLRKAIEDATPAAEDRGRGRSRREAGCQGSQRRPARRGRCTQSDVAAGPLKAAAAPEVAPASSQEAPPETTLQPEPLGPAPAPVSAASVVPAPLPAEHSTTPSDRAPTDQAMAENNVTKEQLEKGNEPAFGQTLQARSAAEQHEAGAEARYRRSRSKVQDQAQHAAQAELAKGLGGMHGVAASACRQGRRTAGRHRRRRTRPSGSASPTTINGIKDKTRADVDRHPHGDGDRSASEIFEAGPRSRRDGLRGHVRGSERRRRDLAHDLGRRLGRADREARSARRAQAYLRQVDVAIDEVADCVDSKLAAAKARVAGGPQARSRLSSTVSTTASSSSATRPLAAVIGRFRRDGRRDRPAPRRAVDKLAQQYKASYERMSAMEDKLREENKSLWQRVYDATVGLIKKIIAFKDMLLGILAKAAGVIADIIARPDRLPRQPGGGRDARPEELHVQHRDPPQEGPDGMALRRARRRRAPAARHASISRASSASCCRCSG